MRALIATFVGLLIGAGCHLAGGVSDLRYDDDGMGAGAGDPVDSCNDGVQNNDEFSIDCGGSCKTCNGMDCDSSAECKSGYCNNNGECRACTSQTHCPVEDYCDEPTGICKPELPEGSTCIDHLYCQNHLYCEPSDSTCKPKKPEGSACEEWRECVDGFYCSFDSDICIPQLENGEWCESDVQCLSLQCSNNYDVCYD